MYTAVMKLRTIIDRIEASPLSPGQSVSLIASAIFLRTFFENFTNSNNGGTLNGFLDTFFHYPLWFGCVFLSAMLILTLVAKVPAATARTLIAYGSFLILLPPLADILIHGFAAQPYSFLAGDYPTMAFHFATLMLFTGAVGVGIKLEVLLALGAMLWYVLMKTGNVLRGILAALLLYISIFFFLSLPVWSMSLWQAVAPSEDIPLSSGGVETFFFQKDPAASNFWPRPIVVDVRESGSLVGTTEADHVSVTVSSLLLLLFTILLCALYARAHPAGFQALIKNVRYTRVAHYLFLAALGCYLGFRFQDVPLALSLGDVLSFLLLGMSLLFAWLYAVWENDEEDVSIDSVSNEGRPLVAGVFSRSEWHETRSALFVLALSAGFLAGWYPFIFVALFLLLYHLYSCPPLRLKRVIGLSSAIVAGNALLAVLAGFFLSSGTESLAAFPPYIALGIFLIFLLAENVKNMKDIAGDRAEGIVTLPVLLGERYGPHVVAALAALAFILTPFFFGLSEYTLLLAGICAFVAYLLIVRKPFRELPVFLLYLAFFVAFFALVLAGLA